MPEIIIHFMSEILLLYNSSTNRTDVSLTVTKIDYESFMNLFASTDASWLVIISYKKSDSVMQQLAHCFFILMFFYSDSISKTSV